MARLLVIPDTQVRPGVPTHHLGCIGALIRDKRPDLVVHVGDHWDMPSLCSYNPKGSASMEGARVGADFHAGNLGMALLTKPWASLRSYAPKAYLLRGNHENRVRRIVEADPYLSDILSEDRMKSPGWTVVPFLKVLKLGDTWFSHYFHSSHSPRPYSGTAQRQLGQVGNSFVAGHVQGLQMAVQQMADGGTRRALIAGSCYLHNEEYRGPQGTSEWRGVVMLNSFGRGTWSQTEIDLPWLIKRYG